jgi:ATP-binding cassette subfamily F protein 3
MILLSCDNISKSFGVDTILEEISFSVSAGTRMGIVGTNGAGKTTLFRIITGALPYDSGNLYKAKDISIGYLKQNETVDSSRTVWEEVLTVYKATLEIEKRIRSLEHEISRHTNMEDPEYLALSEEYADLLELFAEKDGYIYESHMRGILTGLGFSADEFNQPIWQLSGGQKTRAALAKLLLKKPDLLLLDEPTNHLDLDATQWLESFLRDYDGTILMISHDRYFLDRLCSCILEVENHKSVLYQGNYSEYHRKKEQMKEIREKEYELQQKEIQRQEAIIQRYRSFNREKSIKAAESRQKALDRMVLVDRPVYLEDIRMSFHAKKHSGNDILKAEDLAMAFDGKTLFENVSFALEKGDRVGIIGPNGIGKTTLFRILLGQMQPVSGDVKFGTGVDIGYYDQEQSSLNPDNTVILELWNAFPQLTETQIRNTLALFLFSGDDVYKNVKQLSGGERGRVMLAKLMLAGNNFLLLDEPTNHLDMASKEVLEESLKDYPGTILAISHDRYFLNKIVNRILLLEDTGVTEYLGNYDDYVERKNNAALLKSLQEEEPAEKTRTAQKEERRREREERQKRKAFNQLLKEAESTIKSLEEQARDLEEKLCDPELYKDPERMLEIQQQYNEAKSALDTAYEKWLELQESADL